MLKEERPQFDLAKSKGGQLINNITQDEEGQIQVIHIASNQKCEVTQSKKKDKYAAKNPNGTRRYITPEQIRNYINLQIINSKKISETL